MRVLASFAAAAALCAAPAIATAGGLLSLAGLTAVRTYEVTFTTLASDFATGDDRLTTRIDPLTLANRDFGFYPTDENYDIFVSNADGALNPGGYYLTIEGNCDTIEANCFNINEVSLFFGTTEVFADVLTNAVYGLAGGRPGSAVKAVDGRLDTFTELGDTFGRPGARTSITVGFSAYAPPSGGVPEPATWAMLLAGFTGLGVALRARRRARVAD